MAIAFFDLDKTLLAVNSATLWVRFEARNGQISMRQALRAMGWLLRYRMGDVALDGPIRESIATLRGQNAQALAEKTAQFYARQIRHLYRPGALVALRAHRERGDQIVLLSSTTEYLAKVVFADLQLDGMLCTRFEVDGQGAFTGHAIEPLCFGAGKLVAAEKWCQAHNENLADATFYSDSFSDLPVFAAVGRPVAVNPDAPLRRHARRRGWLTLDWGRPSRARPSLAVEGQLPELAAATLNPAALVETKTPTILQ